MHGPAGSGRAPLAAPSCRRRPGTAPLGAMTGLTSAVSSPARKHNAAGRAKLAPHGDGVASPAPSR